MTDNLFNQPHYLGNHLVPGIWSHFFPEEFRHFRFPRERNASCGNCPMVVSDGFHGTYKCCTHIPRVPNFNLGAALQDPKTAPLIEKMIARGFATPEGTVVTPGQARTALAQNAAGNFGKNIDTRCDFLDPSNGNCGIYLYRNSVCSTFFCKSDFDSDGVEFWERIQGTAGQIESALSQWVMQKIGFDVKAYFKRFDDLAQGMIEKTTDDWSWSEDDRKILWGAWFGKEKEFYLESARLVLEHKDQLYELACATPILEPELYESRFRDSLSDVLRKELDEEIPAGTPVPVDTLWYKLSLAHRNLWLLPDSALLFSVNPELVIETNPGLSPLEKHYRTRPYILRLADRVFYFTEEEHTFLAVFRTPRNISHDFLEQLASADSWSFFLELQAKKLVLEH